jgi:hypothetical protein
MEKRTKLALLILLGLLLLALGLYFLLSPFITQRQAAAPPPAAGGKPLITSGGAKTPSGGASQPVTPATPEVKAKTDGLHTLENKARIIVERVGSGASRDGFLGYQDVMAEATASGRTALVAEQIKMQLVHPASGSTYGISTQAIAANVTSGSFGDPKIVITVQAMQAVDAGVPTQPLATNGKQIKVTFVKQAEGSYLVESLEWTDIQI